MLMKFLALRRKFLPASRGSRAIKSTNALHAGQSCRSRFTGIVLLAVAVYFQLTNIEHYWYAPLVNLYSLVAGVFIISRFFIAAFYVAPRDAGYEPFVTVCVPSRNEEDSIITTIVRIYSEGYSHAKLEVIAVNDASTDRTFAQMLKVQSRFPALVIVNFIITAA